MGDIVEITTHKAQAPTYYKITSSAISFELKGLDGAVGLTESPGKPCHYFVIFGRGNCIIIKGAQGIRTSQQMTRCGLSNTQYRRFWIAWDSGLLRVGKDREPLHLHSYPNVTANLHYVFFITRMPHLVSWRFELPPAELIKLPKPQCKPVTSGDLRWVPAERQLPDNAVIGGFEGECLYIVRGSHRGSMTPGKFVPSEGLGYVPWGGESNEVPVFEILVGHNFTWVQTGENRIPVNAFVAGYSEVNREKLYVGRVAHMNCLVPGKVQPSHKTCYIAFEGKEVAFKEYEILIVPNGNPYAENYFCNNCRVVKFPHLYINNEVEVQDDYENEEQSDGDDDDSDQYVMEDDV